MSYSRWGSRGSGHWYTYWHTHPQNEIETRDSAIFDICAVMQFSAKELRENIDKCIEKVSTLDKMATEEKLEELKIYIREFLIDVDKEYLRG